MPQEQAVITVLSLQDDEKVSPDRVREAVDRSEVFNGRAPALPGDGYHWQWHRGMQAELHTPDSQVRQGMTLLGPSLAACPPTSEKVHLLPLQPA